MEMDLKALEEKIAKLVGLCASLREENQSLRNHLGQAKSDADRLKNNMQLASNKLEHLLGALPAEGE